MCSFLEFLSVSGPPDARRSEFLKETRQPCLLRFDPLDVCARNLAPRDLI